jgi:hypothetical protein
MGTSTLDGTMFRIKKPYGRRVPLQHPVKQTIGNPHTQEGRLQDKNPYANMECRTISMA